LSGSQTGLIFYPGGRVDPRSYAPLASSIAQEGFTVIVVPMPLNFAFFGVNRASEVIQAFPDISDWAIGGHSLGGAMAVEYAKSNLDHIDGLVLWASYPAENTDLSETDLVVTSIYASNDGLATLQDIQNSKERLPEDAQFVLINGGNHAGFGWYGSQSGDGIAQISKINQQEQIVSATLDLLASLGNN
ncbi:MAG: alpha/beta hydrolase, partial [Anaerolineales bacterium]